MRLKVKRAKKHVRDLEKTLDVFLKRKPYFIAEEIEPDTGDKVYRVRVRSKAVIPEKCPLVIGDALNNLRSALEYLACLLVAASGNAPDKRTQFPICESLAKYEKTANGTKIQGVSATAISILDALKPYKGGNDGLWLLGELNNFDKHRLLVAANCRTDGVNIAIEGWIGSFSTNGAVAKVFLEDGAELARVRPPFGDKGKMDLQFPVNIAFVEPEIVKGEPVIPLLRQLCGLVDSVIDAFAPVI